MLPKYFGAVKLRVSIYVHVILWWFVVVDCFALLWSFCCKTIICQFCAVCGLLVSMSGQQPEVVVEPDSSVDSDLLFASILD